MANSLLGENHPDRLDWTADRTLQPLSQTNSRLLTEIAEREEAQVQVIEQHRIMAV